jgi:DNA (cytosine-5)-methyltransferase 1
MRYGSVCSGIEAATAAWHHMGWEAAFFSEIEKFPCAVLEHRYPNVPLHGDFTTIKENEYGKIDLLVGGTPCQSFSVAGLRGGLDDGRGNLALEFCRLAQREQPRWIVWENVPGVLSLSGGRDFGSILGALEDLGYGLAYRVLDAQYFGVAQRRRRVFVVGYLGDWRPAAAVLFERHSMSWHSAPSRQARQEAAGAVATGTGGSGSNGRERPDLAGPLTAGMHKGPRGTEAVESGHVVTVGTLRAHHTTDHAIAFSSNMSVPDCQTDGTTPTLKLGGHGGGNPPAVAFAIQERAVCENPDAGPDGIGVRADNAAYTLEARSTPQAVAYDHPGRFNNIHGGSGEHQDVSPTLKAGDSGTNRSPSAHIGSTVRRLTPVECERLQGFPDNFTAIPWRKKGAEDCPDGPRYKALGNSMAVPVMRWIGERINLIDDYLSII